MGVHISSTNLQQRHKLRHQMVHLKFMAHPYPNQQHHVHPTITVPPARVRGLQNDFLKVFLNGKHCNQISECGSVLRKSEIPAILWVGRRGGKIRTELFLDLES